MINLIRLFLRQDLAFSETKGNRLNDRDLKHRSTFNASLIIPLSSFSAKFDVGSRRSNSNRGKNGEQTGEGTISKNMYYTSAFALRGGSRADATGVQRWSVRYVNFNAMPARFHFIRIRYSRRGLTPSTSFIAHETTFFSSRFSRKG